MKRRSGDVKASRVAELEAGEAAELRKQLDATNHKSTLLNLKLKRLKSDCDKADNANRNLQSQLKEARAVQPCCLYLILMSLHQ